MAARQSSNHRHFNVEHKTQVGNFFAGVDHVADDRQIERRQQVSRLVEDDRGSRQGCPPSALATTAGSARTSLNMVP
jgi:hypothetical protein